MREISSASGPGVGVLARWFMIVSMSVFHATFMLDIAGLKQCVRPFP